MERISTYMIDPAGFFAGIFAREPKLSIPILIVAIGGIISAISVYQVSRIMASLFSGMSETISTVILVFAGITGFIMFFIIWLIFGGLIYLIARHFKSQYSLKRILEITGYGMIPLVIATFISMILGMYCIPMIDAGSAHITSMTDPEAIQGIVEKATRDLMQDSAFIQYTLISSLFSIIFTIWTANQWIFGLQAGGNLTGKQAAIAGGVPAVIYMLFTLYSLVTSLGWVTI